MEPENDEAAKNDPPPPPPTPSAPLPGISDFTFSGPSLFGNSSNGPLSLSSTPLENVSAPSLFGGATFAPSFNTMPRDGNTSPFSLSSRSGGLFNIPTLPSTSLGIFSNLDLNRGTRNRRINAVQECGNSHSYVMHISATAAFLDSQPEMLRAADYKKGDRSGTGYRPTIPPQGESSQTLGPFSSVHATFPSASSAFPPVYSSGFSFGRGHGFARHDTGRTVPGQGQTSYATLGQHLQSFPEADRLPTMSFEHVENMIINFYTGNTPSSREQSTTEDTSEMPLPASDNARSSGSNAEQREAAFTLGQSRPSAERSPNDVTSTRTQPSPNASMSAFTGQQNEQQH